MRVVVTGTDTGIGKTVFAAALARAMGASYWKPIQSGLLDGADGETVATLGVERVLPEAYRLTEPLSPHRAAELDDVVIDPAKLVPPADDPLVIEGAGGVLVPVTRDLLYADVFARWGLPVVLVARTGLGTINHSLLSVEALRARAVTIHGIALVGDANEDNEATICAMAQVKRLGRLPKLDPLDAESLAAAFTEHFDLRDFQ
ncbi:ATP-dependent dethiobiotin synthetase BioD [Sphingomonas sp. CGMCC 1.13654]|uniref:ATP-dependent dethiobiotin synthetase BioD n=1 Tax=Sphingomonas chungangi TaxID=2683589 RepID=A0A838L3Y0_9SPHN|nr:dethiobiotin synthase [Sphingomonas chungangi]MBA2933119.1 ATP-dependent dethiobiotin synthetase BioD [Sphingomonas chungangi]MVW56739.1 ATP-dependent dethiobiotin synthetase BioD [Sphingomonas chungangi]